MTNLLIRHVTDNQIARLDELARQAGQSRQEFLLGTIAVLVEDFNPDIVLGFTPLIGGELGPDAVCLECGQEFGERGVFIGFTGSLRPFGPLCSICATTN